MEIQPTVGGPTEMKHIKHVKYILPTDKYINQLPDYSGFGRKTTLRILIRLLSLFAIIMNKTGTAVNKVKSLLIMILLCLQQFQFYSLTLRINPNEIPNLHWKLVNTYHTTDIGQTEITSVSIHDITVDTFTCICNTSLNTATYTTPSSHEPLVCSVLPLI